MRFLFFMLLSSFFFQSCGLVIDKLNLSNLALLFSRSGKAEVSGIAMKGRVMGARVQVMPLVNNACDRTGATAPFAETTTDENGNYSVRFPKNGKPVCVLVTPSDNGRTVMYDETLLRDIAWTEKNFYLDTIVQEPSGPTQAGVVSSPFSRMAARVFAKTMEKADPSFAPAVANASSRQVVSMFGLNKGFAKKETKGVRSQNKSPNAHPRSFGKRNIPKERSSVTRKNSGSTQGSRNVSSTVVPTLEELKLDFTKPDDPFVATSIIKLSGISALANGFANGAARSIQKGLTTRATANGDALELVIDGFSEVIESGGRRNRILTQVFTQSTGRAPPANFSRNPLEATMQSGISSFVQNSAGASQFGLSVDEIESLFQMSSTPPTSLMVDTSSAPDYLYYADNTDEGALVLFTNTQESYYPWVEGGLPTRYEVRSGTLPPGMSLNPVTGELSGTPTTATTTSSQVTIRASNLFGSTATVFRVKVQNFVAGQVFAFVYDSDCTQSTTCNLSIGIEGIRNYNYVINSFTSTSGTFRLTSGILGTFSGTAANVNGPKKGTVSYTDLNTGTSATAEVDFYIDPNTPTATVWASELVEGSPFSYVAFDVSGVGEFGTYSFVPQDFGNGMNIDRFGVISGNPITSGTWSPTITVINASGQRFSVSLGNLTIGVAGSTPQFIGLPEILFLLYTGNCEENTPDCSLSIDTTLSALPSGVTFSSLNFSDPDGELSFYGLSIASNGTITGTPNTGGSIFVNITGTSSTEVVYNVFASIVIGGGVPSLDPIETTAIRVYGQHDSLTCGVPNNNGSCGGGAISNRNLNRSGGVSIDPNGTGVYISDQQNGRVLFFPGISTTATRVYGTTDYTSNGNTGASSTTFSLQSPGNVPAVYATIAGIYASDILGSRVLFFPGISTTATRVYGQYGDFNCSILNNAGGCSGSSIEPESLYYPEGVTVDSFGDHYIADISNHRVLVYSGTNTSATDVYGQPNLTSGTANNEGMGPNTLHQPRDIAIAPDGVYITDQNNSRVLFYPGNSKTATRVYGQYGRFDCGVANSISAGCNAGSPSADTLNQPWGIKYYQGSLYVADWGNNRVLEFQGTSTTAVRVWGQADFISIAPNRGSSVGSNTLSGPFHIDVDETGMYVSDNLNSRVLFFPR